MNIPNHVGLQYAAVCDMTARNMNILVSKIIGMEQRSGGVLGANTIGKTDSGSLRGRPGEAP
jgi:hypothetical protein